MSTAAYDFLGQRPCWCGHPAAEHYFHDGKPYCLLCDVAKETRAIQFHVWKALK